MAAASTSKTVGGASASHISGEEFQAFISPYLTRLTQTQLGLQFLPTLFGSLIQPYIIKQIVKFINSSNKRYYDAQVLNASLLRSKGTLAKLYEELSTIFSDKGVSIDENGDIIDDLSPEQDIEGIKSALITVISQSRETVENLYQREKRDLSDSDDPDSIRRHVYDNLANAFKGLLQAVTDVEYVDQLISLAEEYHIRKNAYLSEDSVFDQTHTDALSRIAVHEAEFETFSQIQESLLAKGWATEEAGGKLKAVKAGIDTTASSPVITALTSSTLSVNGKVAALKLLKPTPETHTDSTDGLIFPLAELWKLFEPPSIVEDLLSKGHADKKAEDALNHYMELITALFITTIKVAKLDTDARLVESLASKEDTIGAAPDYEKLFKVLATLEQTKIQATFGVTLAQLQYMLALTRQRVDDTFAHEEEAGDVMNASGVSFSGDPGDAKPAAAAAGDESRPGVDIGSVLDALDDDGGDGPGDIVGIPATPCSCSLSPTAMHSLSAANSPSTPQAAAAGHG